MYPAEFEYVAPTTLDETIDLLDHHGDDARLLSGGQSLVPMMNLRLLQPRVVIDISRLPSTPVHTDGDTLVIPSGTRHRQLMSDKLIEDHAPMVVAAASYIGNVRVRSRGTIGGSVAHADPAAELPCVLTALDAAVVVRGGEGRRTIPVQDFFLGYLTTALRPTEVVTEIRIPMVRPKSGHAFAEFTRRASDFALVEAAATVSLDRRRRRCEAVSLVFGGVQDRPLSVGEGAAAVLVGELPSEKAFAEVAGYAAQRAEPHDDVHSSAAYRLRLIKTLGIRVLREAVRRARGR